ncbi:pyridoxamine 5'-phosphate oxidase family protein [Nocardioides sp. ChNu-99]|uniref:pyridoxamine 5'-phosphate oxidase family protein n=1 Tax=Nocardioides sp. ChNu-99 TaxID=2839897 RepID=UPI0024062F90|nr:pyridoxamine 5'-phosphate oxidase family protein [Nocardioides sp. ChNu-99]MDF9716704.1 pyridoxamine 5'-phosphate oxidase family protein [Nocardioides sp. ChNu-99]
MSRRPLTDVERRFLAHPQGLARLATVDVAGLPHVVPTVWRWDAASGDLLLTGRDLARTVRARNVAAHPFAAAVVDGVADGPGWQPWALAVRGPARYDEGVAAIRLTPLDVTSWGLEAWEATLPAAG